MPAQASTEALRRALHDNSANRVYYLTALEHSATPMGFAELADILARTPAPATCTVAPKNAITNLVNHGALELSATVDGQPYKGGVEQLQADENLPEGADIRYWVTRTEAGEHLLSEEGAGSRTMRLLEDKPGFADALVSVLELCMRGGAPKSDIEERLKADPDALRIDARTGLPGVSAAFYTTNLEDAGALVWAGGVWKATRAGELALAAWKRQASE